MIVVSFGTIHLKGNLYTVGNFLSRTPLEIFIKNTAGSARGGAHISRNHRPQYLFPHILLWSDQSMNLMEINGFQFVLSSVQTVPPSVQIVLPSVQVVPPMERMHRHQEQIHVHLKQIHVHLKQIHVHLELKHQHLEQKHMILKQMQIKP